jgi:hypothetical protein
MFEKHKKSLVVAGTLFGMCLLVILIGMVTTFNRGGVFAENQSIEMVEEDHSSEALVIEPSTAPLITNNNVININSGNYSIHDLTEEEWEGIKGLRSKESAQEYIDNNPDCTLTEVVTNVKGFGIKSAEKIETYISSKQ